MKEFFADLHIHSCLSPCASIMMLPHLVAEKLIENNIKIVSITDHNSLLNLQSFYEVFTEFGIFLIPGVEIQTLEEVHVLGYFDTLKTANQVQNFLNKHISKIKNHEDVMGYQLLTDKHDNYVKKYENALTLSTDLNIDQVIKMIKDFNGIAIAAHIDKTFGVVKQLGFVPEGIFDAVEVYEPQNKISNYTNLSSSDAHYLNDIKKPKMKFVIEDLNFKEIELAIKGIKGRKVCIG